MGFSGVNSGGTRRFRGDASTGVAHLSCLPSQELKIQCEGTATVLAGYLPVTAFLSVYLLSVDINAWQMAYYLAAKPRLLPLHRRLLPGSSVLCVVVHQRQTAGAWRFGDGYGDGQMQCIREHPQQCFATCHVLCQCHFD